MVRDIRNVEMALGKKEIFVSDSIKETKVKLERSIASVREISEGEYITEKDLHLLSPGDGFKWIERNKVIGKKARTTIPKDEIIYHKMIE
jgi:sialic acid synthase